MLSVGIDVGTTTTQVVISRLTVTNQARAGFVPRLDVDQRTVLYRGDAHFTPLVAPDAVDVDALVALVRADYAAAGISPHQIETGAVIITGETARTKNAQAILDGLSEFAGDFVVTVAGPHLEAQIAGRGSGAADWSAKHFANVVNVDIGGGSANAALFRSGKHVSSAAAMVGGRQAQLDPASGRLVHLAPSGIAINDQLGIGLRVGEVPSIASLTALTDAMADIIVDLITGVTTPLGDKVALTGPLDLPVKVTAYFLSGGVGRSYYDSDAASTLVDIARYGDVGPLLARSLRANPRLATMRIEQPAQTLRATVLGAASQQVTLSGSTIWARDGVLPLRNLPVIEPALTQVVPQLDNPELIATTLTQSVQRWGGDELDFFAINLDLPERLNYDHITALCAGLDRFAAATLGAQRPLVLVTENDYAQVVGQTIKNLNQDRNVIVVDQIGLGEGDYIDLGEPLFDGRVVPVSVKTLVFYQ